MKCRNKARLYEESVWRRSLHCNGVLGHYGGGFQKSTISLSEFFSSSTVRPVGTCIRACIDRDDK
jgi:hypothetical protein